MHCLRWVGTLTFMTIPKSFFANYCLIGLATIGAWLLALYPNDAKASSIAASISRNRGDDLNSDANVGWQFTVRTPIIVTDLGVWDGLRVSGAAGGGSTPAGGGLGEAHTVTIWRANGTAVAQATVPAGTAGTLVDVFRYVSLPEPVTLPVGIYTISAYYAGNTATPDSDAFLADPIITAPELSYDAGMYWFGAGSPAPNSSDGSSGYFGPNFQFQDAAPTPPPDASQSMLIPITKRRDMVFDYSGNFLYVSTSDGFVRTFDLSTLTLGSTFYFGGTLNGLDIARDNSFLLIAQGQVFGTSPGLFHKLDLVTGGMFDIPYERDFGETGAWDVAIGSNGLALVTTQNGGSGWTPLRQIELDDDTIAVRDDAPGSGPSGKVTQNTQIHRSADGTRFYLLESNLSSGPAFTYSASTNTFGPTGNVPGANEHTSGAVNRNGSLLVFRQTGHGASLKTAPDFQLVHTFSEIDGGVAFDAIRDTLYGVSTVTDDIIAYDTTTFAEKFRLPIGEDLTFLVTEQFDTGLLVASADGRYLALATPMGVRLFNVPQPPVTVPGNAVIALVASINNSYVTAETAGNNPLVANRTAVGLWEQFRVEDLGNGYIALKSQVNGRYVCAENAGASALIANRTAVGLWEQFQLVDAGAGQFALIARINGKYVVAENAGNSSLIANRDAIGSWERFNLFVTIRATINNKLVVAEAAGNSPLIANRDAIGVWEQFQFVNASPGYFALISKANGLYVCAENAGNSSLIANRTAIGVWEQFEWITGGNGNFALKAFVNGLFVAAENAGKSPLIANRTAAGTWEQFH